MEKIKTGIIGCGKAAVMHANCLSQLPESNFVAVYNRNKEKGQAFADKYKVKFYNDLDEMLEKSGVQAIIICTPHPFHKEPAIKAAKNKVHVLSEKPIAVTLKDADQMINQAKINNIKLGVISQRRFCPACIRVKHAIDNSKIGKPILANLNVYSWRDEVYYKSDPWRGTWKNEGGGILVNQGVHLLDLFLWFMGEIDELYGYWANFNHPYIEVDDTAASLVKFKNGAFGQITISNSQNPALFSKIIISGTNGATISVQTSSGAMFIAGEPESKNAPINDIWTVQGEKKIIEKLTRKEKKFFSKLKSISEYLIGEQIKDFLNSIINDAEPLITGEDARKVVELFTAIYRSNKEKKPIKFPLK